MASTQYYGTRDLDESYSFPFPSRIYSSILQHHVAKDCMELNAANQSPLKWKISQINGWHNHHHCQCTKIWWLSRIASLQKFWSLENDQIHLTSIWESTSKYIEKIHQWMWGHIRPCWKKDGKMDQPNHCELNLVLVKLSMPYFCQIFP